MTEQITGRRLTRALRLFAALAVFASALAVVVPGTAEPTADAAHTAQASRYVAISPLRVLDTRKPGFHIMRDRDTLSVNPLTTAVITAANVDPREVVAVAVNLTITGPIAPSWLKSLPTALVAPDDISTSAVNNLTANETIANFSIVPVGANGRISIQSLRSSHVVVDVQGLFVRATLSNAGRFVPLDIPTRVTDTRKTQGKVPKDGDLVIDLKTVGIPASASAALINMVATDTAGSGFLTAYSGGGVPDASNVNYTGVNHTIAGSAIARLDNGKVTIHVSSAATHIVVDVIGYMTGDSAPLDDLGLFVPIAPERHYDSRFDEPPLGTSPIGPRTSRALQIAGRLSVPATGVLGVATNLTMTNTDGAGFLVMYPKEPLPDDYSSVNSMVANHSIANHAIAKLDNGKLRVYSVGRSDFIVDITGYFVDGSTAVPTGNPWTPTNPAPMPEVNPSRPVEPPYNPYYDYLFQASSANASFAAYPLNGQRHYGWNPCREITYAVNSERATQLQMDALNRAIKAIEIASGIDFKYIGQATGSLDTGTVDPRVPGGASAMAVFGFSDPYSTPILAGGTIGIGGFGSGIEGKSAVELASGDTYAWVVRGGFAIIDITDITDPAEIQSAFMHEIAHMVGLDHVSEPGELMRSIISNPPQTVYGDGDKNGLYSIGEPQCPGGAPLLADAPAGETLQFDITRYAVD